MKTVELSMRVEELESRQNGHGDGASLTPKTDSKLCNVVGIYGSFYGTVEWASPRRNNEFISFINWCFLGRSRRDDSVLFVAFS